MSLWVDFEPHSWYKGFAIKKEELVTFSTRTENRWIGYTDDGNTYRVIKLDAHSLNRLKELITEYRSKE